VLEEYLLAQARVRDLRNRGLTDRSTEVQRAARRVDNAELLLVDAVTSFINRGGVVPGSEMMIGPIPPAALEMMKSNLASSKQRRDEVRQIIQRLSSDVFTLQSKQEEHKAKSDELQAVTRRLTILTTETKNDETTSDRIRVMNYGEEPNSAFTDGRKKLAAVGFVLGGGLPVAFIMLLGLLDGRFRYSDEAVNPKRHTQLLGILPYLPARMHDPEQAAVAAHCVHQVRTLLQIGGQMYDRRVFTVTSPTAGDGKTSLSLSLGLSFAASGSKTLLLDFDMVGGGLTSGMQAKTDHGVMDAVLAGSAAEFIKPTSFPNLSILPIGRDDARQVSRLSPTVVRKLIEQVRDQFEVVVIDTGPILGSIEASLACAAADGVILTLGRGQQRQHADRAIDHLSAIGAKLLGVVFNRADANDFKRSVSSASVRSVPLIDKGHTGGNGSASKLRALPAMGPMASTVASGMGANPDEADE
jgi:polysaccharide biosynthesis transport protein